MGTWTPALVERMRLEVLENGLSYGEVAALPEFEGFSRSALIGKASRAGIVVGHGKLLEKRAREQKQNDDKAQKRAAEWAAAKAAPAPVEPPAEDPPKPEPATIAKAMPAARRTAPAPAPIETPAGGVTFHELRDHHCRTPLWPTGSSPTVEQMRFCGKRPLLMQSWCAGCRSKHFEAPNKTRTGWRIMR